MPVPNRLFLFIFLLAVLAGCTGGVPISRPLGQTSPSPATPLESSPTSLAVTSAPTPSFSVPTPGPMALRVWVPPALDPASGTPGGMLLQARLDEFIARRPGTVVEVRVKAQSGPGGMLDSLTTASAAAPLSLPDLVALPRTEMEAAAVKGLIRPFDGLIKPIDETDWYEYARQLARLQNSTFGLPFAGDALILVYRPTALPQPPRTYSETLSTSGPLVFPAADPDAIFTLLQYQASGGAILDGQGRPSLQPKPLAQVLEFYYQGRLGDFFPDWLTLYQEDEQSWEAFTTNNTPMAVAWMSRYLGQLPAAPAPSASPVSGSSTGTPPADSAMGLAGAPLPTPNGEAYTLATGWVWAMATPDPEREKLSAELAEYLTEADFLADWSSAMGYLPPRQSALQGWGNPSKRALASQVVSSARLIPSEDLLASLRPALQNAAIQVLKLESGPVEAAQQAADRLNTP